MHRFKYATCIKDYFIHITHVGLSEQKKEEGQHKSSLDKTAHEQSEANLIDDVTIQ